VLCAVCVLTEMQLVNRYRKFSRFSFGQKAGPRVILPPVLHQKMDTVLEGTRNASK
jgi:hypothetical protein